MADTVDALTHERAFSGSDIYVPALGTALVATGDGGVVIDVASLQARQLNATGAVVWQVLGDDLTVDHLAAELAEAFGAPVEAIWGDLFSMLEVLSFDGFLDEISRTPQPPLVVGEAPGDEPVRLVTPPCGCLTSVEDLDWVEMVALRVGNEIFTVRTNDFGAHQVIAAALGAHTVDDPLAEGYYSVELSADPTEAAPLRLWEGNTILCQTSSTAVLWERLHVAVSRHLRPTPGSVRLSMITAVGPKGAALVPAYGAWKLYEQRDALAAGGVLLADGPTDLDGATGEVIVRAGIEVDEASADVFATLLPGRVRAAAAAPGRVPVVAIPCVPSDGDPLARLLAVADTVLPHVIDAPRLGADAVLAALEGLAGGPEVAPPADADDFGAWLVAVLG